MKKESLKRIVKGKRLMLEGAKRESGFYYPDKEAYDKWGDFDSRRGNCESKTIDGVKFILQQYHDLKLVYRVI